VRRTQTSFIAKVIVERWQAAVACIFITVMAAYTYLAFVGRFAHIVVWAGIISTLLVCMGAGLYLLGYIPGVSLKYVDQTVRTEARYVLGSVLCVVALSIGCCSCRMSKSVDHALQCLEDSIGCVMNIAVLRFEPFVHLLLCLLPSGPLAIATLLLISSQDVHEFGSQQGLLQQRVHRLSHGQDALLAMLLFMWVWIIEINLALSDFVLSYTVQLWLLGWRTSKGGQNMLGSFLRAYWVAARYHLGTLIFGSLVIVVVRPVRLVVSVVVSFSEMKANPVGQALGAVCCCCAACFETYLEPIHQLAFVEVVSNSRPFCRAADAALDILDCETDTKRVMHGALKTFQLAGGALITAIGALTMSCMPQHVDSGRMILLLIGGTIGACVSHPFVLTIDIVADTLLYCRTVDELRQRTTPWEDWSPDVLSLVCCSRGKPSKDAVSRTRPA